MAELHGRRDIPRELSERGVESVAYEERLASQTPQIDESTRRRMWLAADEVLSHGPLRGSPSGTTTGLVLGRIQSGKTTAITALTALARDQGYRLVVAILGSTKLLLNQNTNRMLEGLGIGTGLRSTYGWLHLSQQHLGQGALRRMLDSLSSDRTLLVTVLKHPRHLEKLSQLITRSGFSEVPALIIDDEADQASLNTEVADEGDSATHKAIGDLCRSLEGTLYTQFTATPYAPLLIHPDDVLSPQFVVFLEPGSNYTGAREFFVDHAATVVREVPLNEATSTEPTKMPDKLKEALANFIVGAAWLLSASMTNAPVSMLVHSSHKTDVHKKLDALVRHQLENWQEIIQTAEGPGDLPTELTEQISDLTRSTGGVLPEDFTESLQFVSRLLHIWVVNSRADEERVDWSVSPVHILIGGNKLDRGFTVQGLTVTYLSRPRSPQLDTLHQRARAFGYRSEYLPYCRFYASRETIDSFRNGIDTDEALRISLKDWVDAGRDLRGWADHEPLLLESGVRPTRPAVLGGLDIRDLAGWHFTTRPPREPAAIEANKSTIARIGLDRAEEWDFGRLRHRAVTVSLETASAIIGSWQCDGGCGWPTDALVEFLLRTKALGYDLELPVLLMENPAGTPRQRDWDPNFGVISLMQGRDKAYQRDSDGEHYPGDRYLLEGRSQIQVHRLSLPEAKVAETYALAVRIGDDLGVSTEVRRML